MTTAEWERSPCSDTATREGCTEVSERRDVLPNLYSLVVKTTSFCNLACSYCYLATHMSTLGARIIPRQTILTAIGQYAELANGFRGCGSSNDHACFLWHGGEPTLAGMEFFERCFSYQRDRFCDMRRVRNCLMTNGVGVDDEWVGFLREHHVDVSVSLDGPRKVHDRHRMRRDGRGSFDAALRGYELLREGGLDPGIMCVVSEASAESVDAVFTFFADIHANNVAFVPFVTTRCHVSAAAYGRFMRQFFRRWVELDRPEFYVRDFETVIARLLGGESTLCEYNNCCGNYLALDVDGTVYACDLFLGDPAYEVGNVLDGGLLEALDSSRLASHATCARTMPARCQTCDTRRVCGGGCLFRRLLGTDGVDVFCEVRQQLVTDAASELNRATKQAVGPTS
jgi:uncharacterized protein